MDSGMNSIESMYLNYSGLLEEFSEDVIRSRYAFLYKECMEFLKSQNLESEVRLDEVLLMHAVLDYFSDVSRLKKIPPYPSYQRNKGDRIRDILAAAQKTTAGSDTAAG